MELRYIVPSSPREKKMTPQGLHPGLSLGTLQMHLEDPGPLSSQEGQLNTGRACYGGKQMIWL